MIAAAALSAPRGRLRWGRDQAPRSRRRTRKPDKKKEASGRAPRAAAAVGRGPVLDTYAQIEDRFRQPFGERDFAAIRPGTRIETLPLLRHPPGTGPRALRDATPIQRDEVCTEKTSARRGTRSRLRLIGLILRGTRSYASSATRAVSAGIVRLARLPGQGEGRSSTRSAGSSPSRWCPEVGPGNQPQAERRDIQAHPSELRAEEDTASMRRVLAPPPATPSPEPAPPASQP